MFQDSPFNISSVIVSLWWWVSSTKQWSVKSGECNVNEIKNQSWVTSPTGFFKLNTDGVRNLNSGFVWLPTVARDEYRGWVWGIGRNIRRCSVLQAELWDIYDGL
ncbi:hypothetical protein PVK06_042659 [Gossypium arboreum]|uniref:Uncharacterized protein n=1 Tax=Gossypium arboreum TaxID=29729 RepID=A0ABR0MLB9_GOSAR|nr:hypothetical protein PVK06_042659 [Gossypium arboreum]